MVCALAFRIGVVLLVMQWLCYKITTTNKITKKKKKKGVKMGRWGGGEKGELVLYSSKTMQPMRDRETWEVSQQAMHLPNMWDP